MKQGFYLRWRIEGVPELSRILMTTARKVSSLKVPLWRASKLILADVEENFETEGRLVGGWKPLAPSTVAGRMREGYGGEHPILQKTGALRQSFYSRVDNRRAFVSASSPYFAFHQSRKPRTRLPRRAMLVLTDRTRQNIVEEFYKFVRFK